MENNKIDTIWITDMDGTLLDTATPDWGRPYWKEKFGFEFPAKNEVEEIQNKKRKVTGWWGKINSMDPDTFHNNPISEVVNEYDKVKNKANILKVLMTGRMEKRFSTLVKNVLDSKNLFFDVYALNTGGSTLDNKIKQMGELLAKHPNVKSISQYEDRVDHIPTFKAWGDALVESGRLEEFNLYHFDGIKKNVNICNIKK